MEAAGIQYELSKGLINTIINKFFQTYGGDIEELQSQANYWFTYAYRHYNPTKGKFSTWLRAQVWFGLVEFRCENCLIVGRKRDNEEFCKSNYFGFIDLLDELSDDARQIVNLVIDTPSELQEVLQEKNASMLHSKTHIRKYLQNLGWAKDRILETFDEITEVLNG